MEGEGGGGHSQRPLCIGCLEHCAGCIQNKEKKDRSRQASSNNKKKKSRRMGQTMNGSNCWLFVAGRGRRAEAAKRQREPRRAEEGEGGGGLKLFQIAHDPIPVKAGAQGPMRGSERDAPGRASQSQGPRHGSA